MPPLLCYIYVARDDMRRFHMTRFILIDDVITDVASLAIAETAL
jgi:hypothetical protein